MIYQTTQINEIFVRSHLQYSKTVRLNNLIFYKMDIRYIEVMILEFLWKGDIQVYNSYIMLYSHLNIKTELQLRQLLQFTHELMT